MGKESSDKSDSVSSRKLVLPGDLLETKSKPGHGIFRRDGRVHASVLGYSSDQSGYMNVNAIAGRYTPKVGDKIVAICVETGPSVWRMDIGASFNSTLHHSESGWKVPFGDTARFLTIGDAIWAEVFMVDAAGSHQISLKKDDCRKLYSGTIVKMGPTNVPRVIGKQGSMITAIREKTQTRILIGQNGNIWIDGKGNDIATAQKAIEMIDNEANSKGLTKKIEKLLEK
jgi:exosome complex component RRP4